MLYEEKLAEEAAELEGDRDEPKCPRCGGPGNVNEFGSHMPCDDCPDVGRIRIVERADGAVEFRVPAHDRAITDTDES